MALGNIIGSGIFLASSLVIKIAGPWAPFAYLLGAAIMMMEVSFLIEMSIANPVPTAFKACAEEVFGDWYGYVNGWVFWISGVLGMSSEVTACAIFMRLWLPHVPLWVFSLIFAVIITLLNLNDLKGLSHIEFGLASTKIATLTVFVILGVAIALGMPIGNAKENLPVFYSLFSNVPAGIKGLLGSMLIVLFAYTGTGIIGIASTETRKPENNIPGAVRLITCLVGGLYFLAVLLIVAMLPAGMLDATKSPFVSLFHLFEIPYAANVVNFILVTAALSALNSQVYSASRMLNSLAQERQAPRFAAYKTKKGVPVVAVLLSGLVLMIVVLLSYVLPQKIFVYTVSAAGFLALANWMSVSVTHYFYRKKLLVSAPEKLKYKAPFYPYLPWICLIIIVIIMLSAPLNPEQLPGIISGIVLLVLIAISGIFYSRWRKKNSDK
jgi:L-asparagine transporter-like permease